MGSEMCIRDSPVGIIVAIVFLGIFLYTIKKRNPQPHYETLHK